MTVAEQMKETKKMMISFEMIIDDIEEMIKMKEEKAELTEADEKLLQFAKHLQRHYQ